MSKLTVNGVPLNFDFTSPADMMKYKAAREQLKVRAAKIQDLPAPEDDEGFTDAYIDMLNQTLQAYGNFMDDVFGDGTADKLLGDNPSLTKVFEITDEIEKAAEQQGKDLGKAITKYTPNRATRRKNGSKQ